MVWVLCLNTAANAEIIGHWKFDGNFNDSVGTNHGTGNGNVFAGTSNGMLGGAAEFDGSGDSIVIPTPSLSGTTWSLTWWSFTPAGSSNTGYMVASGNPSGFEAIFFRRYGTDVYAGGVTQDTNVSPRISLGEPGPYPRGHWHHHAVLHDGETSTAYWYIDGILWEDTNAANTNETTFTSFDQVIYVGNRKSGGRDFEGKIDDLRFYNEVLAPERIQSIMLGEGYPYAMNPNPKDGSIYSDTWVNLSWSPGDFAVSHDVYLSDNFDDVNDGTEDTFRGNQDLTYYVAGFSGNAYPDGLVPGTTYYWRIDEVNDAEPNSPWKGIVWSFSIPPKIAYDPNPVDREELVDLNVQLKWTAGFSAKLHYIVFGEDFDEVSDAETGEPKATTTYNPGQLKLAKTYYWRIDEFDGVEIHKGEVWSFTTEGAASNPNPSNGAIDVKPSVVLSWDTGAVAASHDVYFGTNADAVKNATTNSPEYKGPQALGEDSFDPGELVLNTTYYWRIDEVNDAGTDSPWQGSIWSFTTGDFFVIDDFEDYDSGANQIWYAWHDGLGYGAPGSDPYFSGNGTGSAVGDETTSSYTEEIIVHGGSQSMPLSYDNSKQDYSKYSEVELELAEHRNWTEEGVEELSIWFRGYPASVGSFVESPAGTYTITASGTDIWEQADEFHYAFKNLTGVGSIVAKVLSVDNTDPWAKAGAMIRETLDAGSKFAAVYITPGNGCRFQARTDTDIDATSDTSVVTAEQTAVTAPYWIKLERDISGNFKGYYSANGSAWTPMSWNPRNISMSSNVYVGLALTSHNTTVACEAMFSNVTITGTADAQWMNQDIGILSNTAEPLYVAVSNSTGAPAVVVHDDPGAATIDTWTEWVIPLQTFVNQGINLTNVTSIAIGLGTKGNIATPGGSGKMYFDDIRLYQPSR
jgi:hypothetical protein